MANTCKACRAPAAVRDTITELHARDVPYRSMATELEALGYPILRDALYRHCRDHLPSRELLAADLPKAAAERATGVLVATIVAKAFEGWPGRAGRAAAFLRAEGLHEAADALFTAADIPDSMRAGIRAGVGSPASELLEARVLVRAVRRVLGAGHPEVGHELATVCRALGGDDLASALDDLAASVEHSDDPAERSAELQRRSLATALAVRDFDERGRALQQHSVCTGDSQPYQEWLAQLVARTNGPGGRRGLALPSAGSPTTKETT